MSGTVVEPRITSVGARTPLGLNALQVAMCARAAQLEPRSSVYRDRNGIPIGVCRVPSIPDDVHGFDRWVALGAPALRECAWQLEARPPLLLSLPEEDRPDNDARIGRELCQALASASGSAIDAPRSQLFRHGSAGFAFALAEAFARLAAGDEAVLVGAIESYYHPGVLAWLDGDARLHSESIDGGIIPAEGAAFVLLTRNQPVRRGGRIAGPMGIVLDAAVDREETALSGEPNLARAMTGLVRRIAQRAPDGRIDWILSDWNGEQHRVSEWSKVETRVRDVVPERARHDRLVDEMGDLGAASGAVLLVIACMYWQAGCAPADTALVALRSDGAERGALLVGRCA